jgi:hypothetical protein
MHSPILMFQSSRFEPIPQEDELTSPGIYGRQLAEWVVSELPAQGYQAAGPVIPEDFGWCVPVVDEECSLYVACANDQQTPAVHGAWKAFVFAESSLMSRLFGQDSRPAAVASLFAAVRSILEQGQGIDHLRLDD